MTTVTYQNKPCSDGHHATFDLQAFFVTKSKKKQKNKKQKNGQMTQRVEFEDAANKNRLSYVLLNQ